MAGETLLDFFNLPTAEQLAQWEEEYARMGVSIRELTYKREQLGELIKVAAKIYGGKEASKRGVGNGNAGKHRDIGKGTWMSSILEIVVKNPEGISYEDVKRLLPEPFASKIKRDPNFKSFYGATGKLEDAKKVVRHHSHLFTPEGFDSYQLKVARGEVRAVEGYERDASPIDGEIRRFLADHPRSPASSIRMHLLANQQFATSIKRNSSALYNVLRRLKYREEIVHHGDDATYSLPNENEAPSGDPAGASEVGEAPTSPNDTAPLFRVVR